MAKGGYQIIDMGGAALSETSVTIPGISAKCATGKALLLENLNVGSAESPVIISTFAAAALSSGSYTITLPVGGLYHVIITVDDEDDGVTAATVELAEASE